MTNPYAGAMLLNLSNVPRDYAWGSPALLADLEGREPSGRPEAEVWFGDHPGDPADVDGGGTLDGVTGGSLPYLLKLLAAASPLSIQVHPTIEQAKAGWAREAGLDETDPSRNYRDANHKPELIVALSDRFESLSGLRPVSRTQQLLAVLEQNDGVSRLRRRLDGEGDALRETIGWLLSGDAQAVVDDVVAAVRSSARSGSSDADPALAAVARISDAYPGDPGVVVALLMNHVVLRRGQGLFLRAGLLHAYVSGLGVEIMAASDNVLRGGLTPKRIDIPELLSILDASTGEVPVLEPVAEDGVVEYPVPVADFSLRRIALTGAPRTVTVQGPTMVLVTSGSVSVGPVGGDLRPVPVGTAVFASADERELVIDGEGEAFLAAPGTSA